MIKHLIAFVAVATLATGSAFAANNIGVFNAAQVIPQTDASAAAQKYVQNRFEKEGKELEKQFIDLEKKGNAFQSQASTMSQNAREDKQMELVRKGRELAEKRRRLEGEAGRTNLFLSQYIMGLVQEAAKRVAKNRGLDLILNEGAVTYHSEALDVSNEMIKEINNQWKKNGSKFPEMKRPEPPKKSESNKKAKK